MTFECSRGFDFAYAVFGYEISRMAISEEKGRVESYEKIVRLIFL